MKANRLVGLLLFLMLAVANAQQTNSSPSATTNGALAALRAKAERGDVEAQRELGGKYEFGEGVPQDGAEAIKWYLKAAEHGDADAQIALGNIYYHGMGGVSKDLSKGFDWYLKAAKQGMKEAQWNVGSAYRNGEGVPKDMAEVIKWYRLAGTQGHIFAICDLAAMYENGDGVGQDYAEAVKWYRRAADKGLPSEQWKLGLLFEEGKGVPQDYIGAYKWYNLAAAGGNTDAFVFRSSLATSGALPENVNYAVKSSFLLGFLESVPEVSAKLKEPNTKERKFEDVVKSTEQAAVLVLVY